MTAQPNQYSLGLDKNPANYVPLTPLSFLERTAAIYPTMLSMVYEDRRFTLGRDPRALPSLRVLSRRPRHRPRRHRGFDAAQHPGDV